MATKILDGTVTNYLVNKVKKDFVTKDGNINMQEKSVEHSNTTQTVTADDGYYGLSKVTLQLDTEEKTVKSSASQQVITPADNKLITKVTVEPIVLQEKEVSINDTIIEVTPDNGYDALSKVTINADIQSILQEKTTNFSPNTQVITADTGYQGLSKVTINPFTKWIDDTLIVNDNDLPSDITSLNVDISEISEIHSEQLTNINLFKTKEIPIIDIIDTDADVTVKADAFSYYQNSSIPSCNIVKIEDRGFSRSKITSISISTNDLGTNIFANCRELAEVNLNDINNLPDNTFVGCSALSDIDISKVENLGESCFSGCASLTQVTLNNNLTAIKASTFKDTNIANINIPSSVTTIGNHAFDECSNLSTVTLNDGLISIGDFAFSNTKLANITIPDSVTTIGNNPSLACTFAHNNYLTSVILSNNVTILNSFLFRDCPVLESVTVGPDVSTLRDNVFYNCPSLNKIYINGDSSCTSATTFANSGYEIIYQ